MPSEKFYVSKHIEEGRRIVDFAEARRVLGFVPGEEFATRRLGCGQFLCGVAEGAARVNGLRYCCWEMVALSSVSEALKICCGLPISRRSFPAMRAPRPGVSASANHPK